jgi:ferredoxin/flavodoxin---NADP+ reductase
MPPAHEINRRIPDPLEKATAERILDSRQWTEKLFSVKVSRSPTFRFTPGQWVRLGIPSGSGLPGGVIWRPYSMVSADYDEFLEFFSILVPGGAFSSRLAATNVGDTLFVEKQPYGYLTATRFNGGRHLWLLASGTGIAPYLSILRDPDVWERYEERVLAYSVSFAREIAYRDVLAGLDTDELLGANRLPLRFVPIVTREGVPGTLHERLPTLIADGTLERTAGLTLSPEDSRILICGNPNMLDDVRDALVTLGLRPDRTSIPGHFATENYW